MTEMVKAFEHMADTDARKARGEGPPIAMCRVCPDEPLVSTLVFSKVEFYCVNCGNAFGYLDPRRGEPTPERLARVDEVEAEWQRLSDGIIGDGGVRLSSCATCAETGTPHRDHATAAELEADVAARSRLHERAGR